MRGTVYMHVWDMKEEVCCLPFLYSFYVLSIIQNCIFNCQFSHLYVKIWIGRKHKCIINMYFIVDMHCSYSLFSTFVGLLYEALTQYQDLLKKRHLSLTILEARNSSSTRFWHLVMACLLYPWGKGHPMERKAVPMLTNPLHTGIEPFMETRSSLPHSSPRCFVFNSEEGQFVTALHLWQVLPFALQGRWVSHRHEASFSFGPHIPRSYRTRFCFPTALPAPNLSLAGLLLPMQSLQCSCSRLCHVHTWRKNNFSPSMVTPKVNIEDLCDFKECEGFSPQVSKQLCSNGCLFWNCEWLQWRLSKMALPRADAHDKASYDRCFSPLINSILTTLPSSVMNFLEQLPGLRKRCSLAVLAWLLLLW